MNIPNRMSVKTRFAPRKRHFESTNPFIEPSIAEMIEAGTTIVTLRRMAGERAVQAVRQFSRVHEVGRFHARVAAASPGPLKPVSYTHLRAHETDSYLVCRLLLEKKKT